jgi:hypothetical protein
MHISVFCGEVWVLVALGRLQYVPSVILREIGTGLFESVVPVPISPFSVRQVVGSVPILDRGNWLPTQEVDSTKILMLHLTGTFSVEVKNERNSRKFTHANSTHKIMKA